MITKLRQLAERGEYQLAHQLAAQCGLEERARELCAEYGRQRGEQLERGMMEHLGRQAAIAWGA